MGTPSLLLPSFIINRSPYLGYTFSIESHNYVTLFRFSIINYDIIDNYDNPCSAIYEAKSIKRMA